MEEALDRREYDVRAELDALDSKIEARLDAIWQHVRLSESALALEALRHERRRRNAKAIAVSLLVGFGVATAVFYLEWAAVIPSAELGRGSVVWTIAVAGLALSAIGQLAIGISRYRQSLAAKPDLRTADPSFPAE